MRDRHEEEEVGAVGAAEAGEGGALDGSNNLVSSGPCDCQVR